LNRGAVVIQVEAKPSGATGPAPRRAREADVHVVSGPWRNALTASAPVRWAASSRGTAQWSRSGGRSNFTIPIPLGAPAADRLGDRAGCPAGAHEARIIRDPRWTRRRTDRVQNASDRQARRGGLRMRVPRAVQRPPGGKHRTVLDGGPLHFFDAESGWAIAGG